MKEFIKLTKPKAGDQVAIVSPSAGLPGLFPWVQDLGLERLRDVFGLIPKEYPTTRQMGSSPQDRAQDLMLAFADPTNKAVISSIGGEDQIKILKHLDSQVFLTNPKPFFGFSDNTHFVNYLWSLGIPAYYGGAIMTQYAMQQKMHEYTVLSLKRALFETGEFEITASEVYNDIGWNWAEPENLNKERILEPNDSWFWDGESNAKGILWGGCLETYVISFAVGTYLPRKDDLDGTVLYLETAEGMPEPWIITDVLTGMGERGWFDLFQAVLVGRPKAWHVFGEGKQKSAEQKAAYRQEQRETVLKTIREYNEKIPVIQNLDFGHTDPQLSIPSGNSVRIDSSNRKIFMTY